MSVVIDYVVIQENPANTISAMMTQISSKIGEGLELKSHVTDNMGNIIITYQKSKPENLYRYHIEYIKVDSDPNVTISKMNEMNERLNRIGYTQKSMFLDGTGYFILTYVINQAKRNVRNQIQKSRHQTNRFPRSPR